MTDLEALVVAGYVFADECSVPGRPGRRAKVSDAELVALAVCQAAGQGFEGGKPAPLDSRRLLARGGLAMARVMYERPGLRIQQVALNALAGVLLRLWPDRKQLRQLQAAFSQQGDMPLDGFPQKRAAAPVRHL